MARSIRPAIYRLLTRGHEHSAEGCELYFVSRVEPSSSLPTIFSNRDFV